MSERFRARAKLALGIGIGIGASCWAIGQYLHIGILGGGGAIVSLVGLVIARTTLYRDSYLALTRRYGIYEKPLTKRAKWSVILLGATLFIGASASYIVAVSSNQNGIFSLSIFYVGVAFTLAIIAYAAIVFFLPW